MENAFLIPVFNCGSNPSVENFIESVEICKFLSGWSDEVTVKFARLRMGQKAAQFLRYHGEAVLTSWIVCKKILIQYFGEKFNREDLERRLTCVKQMPNESVTDFCTRVLQIAHELEIATISTNFGMSAAIKLYIAERAKYHFVNGLRSDIRRFVMVRSPCDITSALECAQKEEMHVMVTENRAHEQNVCSYKQLCTVPSAPKNMRLKHRLCYSCKEKGHETINCPRKNENAESDRLKYPETTWLQHVEQEDDKENCSPQLSDGSANSVQPHCQITLKCTKEIAGFNGLSDAIKRLDFLNAVHDNRRFGYICKLLEELLSRRLASLSGCARRVLLATLEEVACEVSASQNNLHLLQQLLSQLRHTTQWTCWGHPLGSTRLWDQHLQAIGRILDIAAHIQITEPGDEQEPRLQSLPEECVREVLLRLSDHKDLQRAGEAWGVMQRVSDEERIWRELCHFHFTPAQLNKALEEATAANSEQDNTTTDWQQLYHKLRRVYGLREDYAEILSLCRNCRCLFWQSLGHPCIVERDIPELSERLGDSTPHVPIPPRAFLKFFSL